MYEVTKQNKIRNIVIIYIRRIVDILSIAEKIRNNTLIWFEHIVIRRNDSKTEFLWIIM